MEKGLTALKDAHSVNSDILREVKIFVRLPPWTTVWAQGPGLARLEEGWEPVTSRERVWNGRTLEPYWANSLAAVAAYMPNVWLNVWLGVRHVTSLAGSRTRHHWPWGLTKQVIAQEKVCLFTGELHNCLFGRKLFSPGQFSQEIPSFSNNLLKDSLSQGCTVLCRALQCSTILYMVLHCFKVLYRALQ